jgi:cell filamentation protein
MKPDRPRDPYLYEDVPVLRNRAGIKNNRDLRALEGELTKASMFAVYATEYTKFNAATIQAIHKQIFNGLFDWAGEFRTISISKREEILGGDTVRYAYPAEIKRQLDAASKEITKLKSLKDRRELVIKLTRIIAAIWQTRPFREGNTRAIMAFAVLLALHLGIPLDTALLKEQASYVRGSLVWASQGIYSKYEYLEGIFLDAAGIERGDDTLAHSNDGGKYASIEGYDTSIYKEEPHTYTEDE